MIGGVARDRTDRTLYVLRHAKSDWSAGSLRDFDRPLAPRGERAAALLARHVADAGIAPDVVLSSPARRARQTIETVLPGSSIIFDDDLYGASFNELVSRVRTLDAGVRSAMLVGHNPGLHDLIEGLTATEVDKFPTGGLATLRWAGAWAEFEAGAVRLTGIVRPRELE